MGTDRVMSLALLVCLLAALSRCASFTKTVDPYPAATDAQHHTQAYQAQPGSIERATLATAAMELGVAVVGKALSKEEAARSERIRAGSIRVSCRLASVPCSHTQIFLTSVESEQTIVGRTDELGEVWFLVQPKLAYQVTLSPSQQQKGQRVKLSPAGPYRAGVSVDLELLPQ